jgi:hypothetical protein
MQGATMARPPKYASDEDKPVSVTLRMPRDLYSEVERYTRMRFPMTMTDFLLEAARLQLETPTDPRDIVLSDENTVTQQLEQMIDARVDARLKTHGLLALIPVITSLVDTSQATDAEKSQDGNTVIQEHRSSYDASKYYLGKLCPQRHEYQGSGQSLLYRRNHRCLECDKASAQARRTAKRATKTSPMQ